MMTDGLKDAHREQIIRILMSNEKVERAVLFGSRATGTHTVSSDVDLVLFGDLLTLTDLAILADDMENLSIPQRVDLHRYSTIKNKQLQRHIQTHGIEWLNRNATQT